MKLDELKNKRILIAGYGREGRAVEEFLKNNVPTAFYKIADDKTHPENFKDQSTFDFAIKSPGVPASKVTIPYTTGTNIFFANINSENTIGVTGSKGKSTTASLIHHILKSTGKDVRLAGNIGNPLISELNNIYSSETIFVCELSSYQLADIQYSPHIAVVVSLFPEHLDYHGNLEKYYAAKENIIKYSKLHDYFIYNPRVKELKSWINKTKAKAIQYQADFIPESKNLIGEHNQDNIRAAITVAYLFHITNRQISEALESFLPLPHRLENTGTYKGITFYDDAISTTPESTMAALSSLKNVKTIFLGGTDRGYNFHELAAALKKSGIESIVLFPESGAGIEKELNAIMNYNPVILHTNDMEKAVQFAYTHTPKGSICLLSTASPSYSNWKNFEEKGDLFQLYVKNYGNEKTNS